MLYKAKEWLERMKLLETRVERVSDKQVIREHIRILEYLITCAEAVEQDLPVRAEISE